MKRIVSIFLFTLLILSLSAQKEANYWFFGEYAGLDFSNGAPQAVTYGALSTMEGCSSISSATGVLQFYTDGIGVWNRNHQQMPNGFGLLGNPSSTQSGIIVPKPGSTNLFYIFTVDESGNGGGLNGLNYSLVDMNLDGFKGDVVASEKNVLLTKPLCEKVTAVGHANGTDIWVIACKWGTNSFYSYLVTADGVTMDPAVSSVGTVINGDIQNAKGYLKVSPDGEKIVKANAGLNNIEIFDFDINTGLVSNHILANTPGTEPYGVEFSPNSSRLYIGSWYVGNQVLYQYNLNAGTPQQIIDSRVQIASGTEGALQLGPDNKIYVARNESTFLSVINDPNELGNACGFQASGVQLSGKRSRWGLPPFIQSFFSFNAAFYNTSPCFGTPTQFYENSSQEPDSVLWNFGNPASGSANTSTLNDPVHLFTSPGFYAVKLKVWILGVEAEVTHMVIVHDNPEIELPNDTSMCDGGYYTIDPGTFEAYLWNTGDTTQTISINQSGNYWVEVTNEFGCINADTIAVEFFPNPVADAGSTQTILMGASTTLEGEITSGSGNYTVEWQPSEWLVQNDILTPQTLPLNTPTIYTLYAEDDRGCVAEPDDVLINIEGAYLSAFPIAEPDEICEGETVHISANVSGGGGQYTYAWTSDIPGFSSTEAEFDIVPESGITKFYLQVTDQNSNTVTGETEVLVNPLPVIDLIPAGYTPLGDDTITACVRNTVLLDAGFDTDPEGTTYYWPDQLLLNRHLEASTNGSWIDIKTYHVEVTHGSSGCSATGDITIIFDFDLCDIGIPDSFEETIEFVNIYPNPNNGEFTLELKKDTEDLKITIVNLNGQIVYEKLLEGHLSRGNHFNIPMDISTKGLYLVNINSNTFSVSVRMVVR